VTDPPDALEPQAHGNDPHKLARSLLQVMDMLQLYRAEVARILGLRCADVAALGRPGASLSRHTPAWREACLLLRCYQALYLQCRGDSAAMYHWLHRELPEFGATPHRLMVDEHALFKVVAHLEQDNRCVQDAPP